MNKSYKRDKRSSSNIDDEYSLNSREQSPLCRMKNTSKYTSSNNTEDKLYKTHSLIFKSRRQFGSNTTEKSFQSSKKEKNSKKKSTN